MGARRIASGLSRALFAGVLILFLQSSAGAADFYAGKTLTFIVGDGGGGGFNIYARLIAQYLARYIPGAPNIVVQNMAGAGGRTAATYVYREAPHDGTTIAALTPDAMMDRLFGRGGQFDPLQYEYLAGAERSTRVCAASSRAEVKTMDQALHEKMIVGATLSGSPAADYANFIKRTTGAKFDIVNGYSGIGNLYLAMERGEIDGLCGADWSAMKAQKSELLRDKKINLLLQVDVQSDPELDALGVPQPWKYIPNDLDRVAVKLMVDFQQAFGKAYLTPPQVPAERVKILADAFADVLHDKQFLADAAKIGIEVAPVSGDEVATTVRNLYAAPAPVMERLRAITLDAKAQ